MVTWVMHCHHEVLFEPLRGPIETRVVYIKAFKPEHERKTRLRLMRVLSDAEATLLPERFVKARAAYNKAGAAYNKAGAAYNKARAAFDKAGAAYDKAGAAYNKAGAAFDKAGAAVRPDLEVLHTRLCVPDCPWDGSTIFPGGQS